ncbi:RNA 3'-terminal phosphate cyclase [Haloglomus halophilum]|uniref:RNA 3'-terminal phosphate cyclase n=1 Tax=Haloglomus halophilum TaxID=2962672 RepID=UPI0020CA1984|nr:RNA 3'-terminal phosphate cyclase [Haloglomus halophilum]
MLDLDGSAGGGQLLRTALALSAVTGRAFEMTGIRGDRPEPGLKSQHLAAVEAVADACDADVAEAEYGSETLTFEPGPVRPGEYEVDIDTAGSMLLVFDALLPLSAALDDDEELVVRATGGTDVKWAPTTDHYRRVKLPFARRAGLDARATVSRRGFYPAGGGEASLRLGSADPHPLELRDTGPVERLSVHSVAAEALADADVAERGARAARQSLRDLTPLPVETHPEYVETDSPGAVLTVVAHGADGRAGFTGLGEKGKPMEEVAGDAVGAFDRFRRADGTANDGPAVDGHTADQLAVVLALAGGEVTTRRLTDHLQTNRDLVAAFGGDLELTEGDPAVVRCTDPLDT